MSELLFVAVPGGPVDADAVVLRVVVVPRLRADRGMPLAEHGLADWPAQLGQHIPVHLRAGDQTRTVTAQRVSPADSRLWQEFFGPGTLVEPWQHRSYAAPQVRPSTAHASKIITTYEQSTRSVAAGGDLASPGAQTALAGHLSSWHDPVLEPRPDPDPPVSERRSWRDPDFHRTVSLLREHPTVLRALGLIVELRLPADALTDTTSGTAALVRVGWEPPAGLPPLVAPWTRYEFDGRHFLPFSAGTIRNGMLELAGATSATADSRSAWQVTTVDVDGGVGRLRDTARALLDRPAGAGAGAGEPLVSLPALRTAGLQLLRPGRVDDMTAHAGNGAKFAGEGALAGAELTAAELMLGYRMDVLPKGATRWLSLCRREATYWINGSVVGAGAEEGHVKANAAVADPATGALRADEVVMRWDGWSLAVPRPALDGRSGRPRGARNLPLPYEFSWDYQLPAGSLPALRFNHTYQLRVRVADLAGGGLGLDDRPVVDPCATDLITYTRYEPIAAPAVALPLRQQALLDEWTGHPAPEQRHPLGTGGAIDLLVIRSDRGLSVAQFAAAHPGYPANDTRLLLPPQVSFALAEQHGVLDGADEQTWRLAAQAVTSGVPDPASAGPTLHLRPGPGGLTEPRTARPAWQGRWPQPLPHRLLLADGTGTDGDLPALVPDDDGQVRVDLAPAQEAFLEISSHLRDDYLDHFAIKQWLPGGAEPMAIGGRHPLATPARVVRLVHAVRRPLRDPAGTVTPQRTAEGQTDAVLQALLDVDTASTLRLDIAAEWTEVTDDVQATVTQPAVASVTLDRGPLVLPTLRQEFGDTRHREVRYQLTAVSRFRQLFDATDDDEDFRARTTLPAVSVPSTARPTPPLVRSVLPAFRWEGTELPPGWQQLTRVRYGNRLRIELARPWYSTGAGEALGVLLETGDDPPADQPPPPRLTRLGRDPIWAGWSPTPVPSVDVFTAKIAPSELRTLPGGPPARVVPHGVWFHQGRWYADIELTGIAGGSYSPFARLVVARYQPHSLPGLELSTPVTTEAVQLLPDRTVQVKRTATDVTVTLSGLGPAGPRTNRVDVLLEHHPGGAGAGDLTDLRQPPVDDRAWTRLPQATAHGGLGEPLRVALPDLPGALRLYVREVERIGPVDDPAGLTGADVELADRTVFVDVIALS